MDEDEDEDEAESIYRYSPATNVFVASLLNLRCCQRLSRIAFSNIFEKLGDFCTMRELRQRFLPSGGVGEGVVVANDIDYMLIDTAITVVEEGSSTDVQACGADLFALTDQTKAGFARLAVCNPESFTFKDCTTIVNGRCYLSSFLYIQKQVKKVSELSDAEGSHGPAVLRARASEIHSPSDNVYALNSPQWPGKALEDFKSRVEHTWLTNEMVSDIEQYGCFFVPVGNPLSSDKDLEWRLSFSLTENYLIKSLNKVQYNCYNFLKLFGNTMHSFKDEKLLCSYFFKTALFWTIEQEEARIWVEDRMLTCIGSVLDRIIIFYEEHNFPNYFLPCNNMIEHLPAEKCTQLAKEFTSMNKDLLYNVFCSLQLGVKIIEEGKAIMERLNLIDFENQLSSMEKRELLYRNVVNALKALDPIHLQEVMEEGCSDISFSSQLYRQKHRKDIRNDLQNFLDPNLFDFLSRDYAVETKKGAFLSVIRNINLIVIEPELSVCFRQVLYRALGNLCHIEALHNKEQNEKAKLLEEAAVYYIEGQELVFPDGFDDSMLSGKVHLAQFHYMNKNLDKATKILNEVDTILDNHELAINISNACVCTEICIPVHLEALNHDKGLFDYFSTLSPRESKFINSVALAHYLRLKCYQVSVSGTEVGVLSTSSPSHRKLSQQTHLKEDVYVGEGVSRGRRYQELFERFKNFCKSYDKIPSYSLIDKILKDTSKLLLQLVKTQ